jgi:predicted DNA binding CopG/RHH family protein
MKTKLNKYEEEILKSFTDNEWREVDNMDKEIEKHKRYADETFKKDKRVNIRLSQRDINLLKIKAMEEGIPYQTLMASVLHKYVTGKFNSTT